MAAPEMKNHLSMLGSMGAGGWFSPGGTGGRAEDSVRKGDEATVRLALETISTRIWADRRGHIRSDGVSISAAMNEFLPGLLAFPNHVGGIP
jgi:hypothetical protein